MKKFKVAIDVSPLNDGNSKRGVGYYTRNLVNALQKEVKNNPEFNNYSIELLEINSPNKNYNLIHYPYFDPFKITLPSQKTPFIVTCHDLIPRAFPKHFPVGIRGEIKWLIQKHRLQQASYIICPSHSAKYQILDYIKYPADRIFSIYEAATPNFKIISDKKALQDIKSKYNLPEKFVLYVGDINWNKNIPGLVRSCIELNTPLVIVGSSATKKVPQHPWTQDLLWLQSQKSPLIHCTGFVPDEDLPYIYNLATLYCQPSFSEGFGLPLIEAMQSGTPVCYSQESCLPEIMDFNGEYFDPYSLDSIKKSINKLWTNESLRNEYAKGALKRSKYFSWQDTAIQTLSLYRFVELDEKK